MTRHTRTLVIIPTYNEAENLGSLVSEILGQDSELEILVVDDNSPDGTGDIADRMAAELPNVHVMHRAGKLGLGTAYVQGFKWALAREYDYVLQMDCDFSHHPCYLPNLLKEIESADLVIGSRYVKEGGTLNWGLLRRFISGGGNLFARIMLRLTTHDCTGGFRCYRRAMLQKVPWDEMELKGYAFQVGSVYYVERLGGKVSEVPIIFEDRRTGKSKMTYGIVVEAFTYVMQMTLCEKKDQLVQLLLPSLKRIGSFNDLPRL